MGVAQRFEATAAALAFDERFANVEVVHCSAKRAGRTVVLDLMIDQPAGVDLALCERLAAHIHAALAAETEPSTLQVESAGLDRPLVKPADFERFRERDVKIQTTVLVDGAKTHRGTLRGVRGTDVILETVAGERALPLNALRAANLTYDIRADLTRDKRERRHR